MNAGPVYYRYKVDAAYHMSFLALSIRYLENNKKKNSLQQHFFVRNFQFLNHMIKPNSLKNHLKVIFVYCSFREYSPMKTSRGSYNYILI